MGKDKNVRIGDAVLTPEAIDILGYWTSQGSAQANVDDITEAMDKITQLMVDPLYEPEPDSYQMRVYLKVLRILLVLKDDLKPFILPNLIQPSTDD